MLYQLSYIGSGAQLIQKCAIGVKHSLVCTGVDSQPANTSASDGRFVVVQGVTHAFAVDVDVILDAVVGPSG